MRLRFARVRTDVFDEARRLTANGVTVHGQEQMFGHSVADHTPMVRNAQREAKANGWPHTDNPVYQDLAQSLAVLS